jgi:tetratricopeptide (TPR) repeat protein
LTLAAAVRPGASQQGLPGLGSEWNNEALFDSTTTRAELMEMGRAAYGMSQFSLAEIYYQESLLRNPEDTEAMCELAALYERTGRLEYARGLLIRAGNLVPGRDDIAENRRRIDGKLRASLGRESDSLVAVGAYAVALPRLSLLLTIVPDDARVHANKARCLSALGESDAALSSIDLALAKDPREEYHRLRVEIATTHEQRQLADLESSARRLLDSKDWMRDEAADVLQAILSKDPANEWAREQFRALNGSNAPAPVPPPPPASRQLLDAMRELVPGIAALLERHLTAVLLFVTALLLFRSPVARALAKRVHDPSPLSGDLARIELSEVLRLVNASALSGVLVMRTPEGTARVYFETGEPVHCAAFRREGTDALTYIVRNVNEGSFEMRGGRAPDDHTIDQPLDLILADGATTAAERGAAAKRNKTRREAGRKKSRMSELLGSKTE